jgi:dTDP-4-dehydrorhamnose reductase
MKVLLLGAKGMLGGAIRKVLVRSEVTAWDREELDITNESQVREKIVAEKPEMIINCAAWTDVDGAEDPAKREACFAVNEVAVRYIAQAAKDMDAPVVHYSTDYVFPGDSKTGYGEDDPPGPAVNVYGESKLAGERALKESGARFYLIRTAWLYGPAFAKASAGKPHFVDAMLRLGQEVQEGKRDNLKVVDDQHGSPTFTKDVAMATREILENGEKYPPGIYHAVNFGQTTWYVYAKKIFELARMQVEVQGVTSDEFPRPAKRPKYSILRNTRGPKLRHWEDALKEYLDSQRP